MVALPSDQVTYRKRIGSCGGHPVFGVGGIGGIHVVAVQGPGGLETIGLGSHPLLARMVAKRNRDDVQFDDLAKSAFDPRCLSPELVSEWVANTAAVRAALTRRG